MTSAPQLPNYLGLPFRILVSPFVNFDPEERTTDIMMFNSRNLGALIVAEEPHVKSWEDGQYNIMNMSIEETYASTCAGRAGRHGRQERDGMTERVHDAGGHRVQPGIHICPAGLPLAQSAAGWLGRTTFRGLYGAVILRLPSWRKQVFRHRGGRCCLLRAQNAEIWMIEPFRVRKYDGRLSGKGAEIVVRDENWFMPAQT